MERPILEPCFLDMERGIYSLFSKSPYLCGMPYPADDKLWLHLKNLGMDSVVCLTHDKAEYRSDPLTLLGAVRFQDQFNEGYPAGALEEETKLRRLADKVHREIGQGRSVIAHCMGGTGRTGTLIAAVLRLMGYTPDEIYTAMKKTNQLRGKSHHGWPESPWQKEVIHRI